MKARSQSGHGVADFNTHLHRFAFFHQRHRSLCYILVRLLSTFYCLNLYCCFIILGSLLPSKEKDLKTPQAHDRDKMADSQEKNYKYRQEISQVGLVTSNDINAEFLIWGFLDFLVECYCASETSWKQ